MIQDNFRRDPGVWKKCNKLGKKFNQMASEMIGYVDFKPMIAAQQGRTNIRLKPEQR